MKDFFLKLAPKATAAGLAAAAVSMSDAISDGSVDTAEWVRTAVAVLVAFVAVYAAPKNAEPAPTDDTDVRSA